VSFSVVNLQLVVLFPDISICGDEIFRGVTCSVAI
jgi:hypothetical protein